MSFFLFLFSFLFVFICCERKEVFFFVCRGACRHGRQRETGIRGHTLSRRRGSSRTVVKKGRENKTNKQKTQTVLLRGLCRSFLCFLFLLCSTSVTLPFSVLPATFYYYRVSTTTLAAERNELGLSTKQNRLNKEKKNGDCLLIHFSAQSTYIIVIFIFNFLYYFREAVLRFSFSFFDIATLVAASFLL